ncbi:MAG: protoheme IX farnesyltransferase [Proteobacteria bacterium]|nr:MAG: protoheme IX farnesyltransferase [Pseudomonadota bacterium]
MEHKSTAQSFPLAAEAASSTPVDWRSYFSMTKPTISLMVVVTVIPALFLTQNELPSLKLSLVALIGTFLASGSSAIFNHLADSDIDQHMKRTRTRPIPAGKISSTRAATLAIAMAIASFALLYTMATPLAAWLGVIGNILYAVVYTMYLKRRTVQNIVLGGAAGCFGPLIGWAAMTGTIEWPAWVLFGIIFLWTPPHFWSLAIKYKDDYARANIPMLPTVKGLEVTRQQILFYSVLLIPCVLSLSVFGIAGWIYGIIAGALTLYFVWLAFRLYTTRENQRAMPLFFYSCFYLFGVFGALTLDRLVYLLN